MKIAVLCLSLVLTSACVWAQASAPAQPPSLEAPATQAAPPMHHPMGPGMHEQHMQEMKGQLEKMHATLDQMKANLAKVKDPAAKQEAQLNLNLWEGMVQHLDGMVKMMSDEGMRHEHGAMAMNCCAGMKEGAQAGGCCGGNKCMQGMKEDMQKGPGQPSSQPN